MAVLQLLDNIITKKAAASLTKGRLAPDFSPFEFMHVNEMLLSKVLAWMLDPSGSHGQGGQFLKIFLTKVSKFWPDEICNNAHVATETCIEDGRTDIYVNHQRWVFIVENKPWAIDQQRQVARYFQHLQQIIQNTSEYLERPPGNESGFIVYLTKDGSQPSDSSICPDEQERLIKNRKLICISYRTHILEWLSDCCSSCDAERVSTFLNDFSTYLQRIFKEFSNMNGILDEMTRSPELVSASMQIIMAGDEFKERILLNLRHQLKDMTMNKNWGLDWQLSTKACTGININFSENDAFVFRVASDMGNYGGFYYGTFQKPNRMDDGSIETTLSRGIAPGQRHSAPNAWSWCRPMRRADRLLPFVANWRSSPQPWSAIADGTLAKAIMNAAEEVRSRISHDPGERALGEGESR